MARGPTVKRRRLSPPGDGETTTSRDQADTSNRDNEWDVEQDYERRPRKTNKKSNERTRLPIKTSEGLVHSVDEPEDPAEETDSFLGKS